MNKLKNEGLDELISSLLKGNAMLATAESCTGGMLAMRLTDIAGSSRWYNGGFITYSNSLKMRLLSVDAAQLNEFGAVSSEVAGAMVIGALEQALAHNAISITGIAGPDGGSAQKPVGTVYIGTAVRKSLISAANNSEVVVNRYQFDGDRQKIRQFACNAAIVQMLSMQ